ncbi:MAG: hypothetical protein ACRBCI_12690 [Cellvibrionaceae bacterium]
MFITGKKQLLCQFCQVLCLTLLLVPVVVFSQNADAASQANPSQKGSDEKSPEDDLIRLESTFVGDKEQPSVSYFIPWKGTDSADDLRWQLERKNDDTLNLVDRDILLRSINIYNEMKLE